MTTRVPPWDRGSDRTPEPDVPQGFEFDFETKHLCRLELKKMIIQEVRQRGDTWGGVLTLGTRRSGLTILIRKLDIADDRDMTTQECCGMGMGRDYLVSVRLPWRRFRHFPAQQVAHRPNRASSQVESFQRAQRKRDRQARMASSATALARSASAGTSMSASTSHVAPATCATADGRATGQANTDCDSNEQQMQRHRRRRRHAEAAAAVVAGSLAPAAGDSTISCGRGRERTSISAAPSAQQVRSGRTAGDVLAK